MSKNKEKFNADFRLIQITERRFDFNVPDAFQPRGDFQYAVSLEISMNASKQKFYVDNRIEVRSEVNGAVLCLQDTRYYFELIADKAIDVLPSDLQISANAISLSTSRGLLYSRLRGTALHNAILPLIDASAFSTNQVGQ
ncbi:hypothetical protein [Mucilaginibacter kameinonensis]|uniref:hypothetical protein n=1 Tax=Mucilaginibacter kameinonensis TaxID=452286 RepID=UPI000EF7F822|nr:hypothetical protein [Mucilaginibacter kameinonensis]